MYLCYFKSSVYARSVYIKNSIIFQLIYTNGKSSNNLR
jgi:hypothetical protein